jgi:hypothetical protein
MQLFSVLKQYTCMILQHPKKIGEPGFILSVEPRLAFDVLKPHLVREYCGRWADLANFFSDSRFRARRFCLFA